MSLADVTHYLVSFISALCPRCLLFSTWTVGSSPSRLLMMNRTFVELNLPRMLASLTKNDFVQIIGIPLFSFHIPIMVTMTIAATRMHRSLVDFATSDMCAILHLFSPAHSDRCQFSAHQNFQSSGVRFAKPKQIRATPIPLDPVEISVHTILQQHLAPQMRDQGLSTNTDEVHQEPNGLTLGRDVERGE